MKRYTYNIVVLLLSLIFVIEVIACTHNIFRSKVKTEASSPRPLPGYQILIDLEDRSLYLLEGQNLIKKYPVAIGSPDTPSPLGFFKIVSKDDWGEGFGGRWLGLNVPWGTYGIHGTIFPDSIGWAASHGCIRMYTDDVKELYSIVMVGTPVYIAEGCYGPFGRGFFNIEPGDRGADVVAIQQRLKELGYFKGWVSGIYDDDLKYALHRFQKQHRLEVKNTITKKDWLEMGFREFE